MLITVSEEHFSGERVSDAMDKERDTTTGCYTPFVYRFESCRGFFLF
jgi:hypothetical protein